MKIPLSKHANLNLDVLIVIFGVKNEILKMSLNFPPIQFCFLLLLVKFLIFILLPILWKLYAAKQLTDNRKFLRNLNVIKTGDLEKVSLLDTTIILCFMSKVIYMGFRSLIHTCKNCWNYIQLI